MNLNLVRFLILILSNLLVWLGLYYTIPKTHTHRRRIIFIITIIIWLISNLYLTFEIDLPYAIFFNSLLFLLALISSVVIWKFYYPRRFSKNLSFGLSHIDEQIFPHYAEKDTITLSDKKDAMSDLLRQISITTIPTTIENLARMSIFEVLPKGKFRVLASHQIDTHRIPKLERKFSHDPSNIIGIVGKVVNTKETLYIPNLDESPNELKSIFEVMEENKLPGHVAKCMLSIPILDTINLENHSKCLAVLSISCSIPNTISLQQKKDIKQYVSRIRNFLISLNKRILVDPLSSIGYRAITISGEVGSGKSTLVAELKDLLTSSGWRIISMGDIFRDFCSLNGIDINQVEKLDDDFHLKYDEFQKNMLKEEEFIIIEGRLSGFLAKDFGDVLTVFLDLNFSERVNRAMQRDNDVERSIAEKKVRDRDNKDVDRYKRLYKIEDYRSKEYYRLYINVVGKSPYELAKIVLSHLKM